METEEKQEMGVEKKKTEKAANTSKILLYIMVFLIGTLLGFLVGYNLPKEASEYSSWSEEPVVVDDQEAVNIILADSIVKINKKLEVNNTLVDSLNMALNKCQGDKKIAVTPKKKVITQSPQEPPQKVVIEVIVKNPEIVEVVAEAPKKVVSQPIPTTKAVAADPLAPLRDGNEEILACLRTNGSKDQHFPHYAINRGASVGNSKGNNQRGYNYVLTPVESISGNVPSITKEGVFFVPVSYLKKYLNMSGETLKYVDLLYEKNWDGVRMTLQGEYYVYNSK